MPELQVSWRYLILEDLDGCPNIQEVHWPFPDDLLRSFKSVDVFGQAAELGREKRVLEHHLPAPLLQILQNLMVLLNGVQGILRDEVRDQTVVCQCFRWLFQL